MLEARNKTPWIIVDGMDAAGKSTIANYIAEKLRTDFNLKMRVMRALGEGAIGSVCRGRALGETPMSAGYESLIMPLSIAETYHDCILTARKHDAGVVVDRWIGSYYAYQVFGRQNPLAKKLFEASFVEEDVISEWPTLYFICNVDIDVAEERMRGRDDNNHFDEESRAFKERVKQGFENFSMRYFNRVTNIDCNQPLVDVLKVIDTHLLLNI